MATKSKAAAEKEPIQEIEAEEKILKEEPEKQEIAEEPAAKDPWDISQDVIVPRKPKGEDQQWYVCVNDRRFMVPANGKMQSLPKPVAEILLSAIQAEYAAEDFADHIPHQDAANPQQHAI
jgi:hypothetical protein